ncbi:hypothetical protein ACN28I_28795 [Archangium gephyra]|uniref:hypothetical protein n=1 Tax=Archangium gephyra TaxID=48 RepID=UPI003B807089
MLKHLVTAALGLGLIACGGTEKAPETAQPAGNTQGVVSVSELLASSPEGQVVVDLRNTRSGFRVEPGVDYSAINVICPSDRVMNLEKWLPELAAEFQTSPASLEKGFTMYPHMAPAKGSVQALAAPLCVSPDPYTQCYLHREPDGSWVCFC